MKINASSFKLRANPPVGLKGISYQHNKDMAGTMLTKSFRLNQKSFAQSLQCLHRSQ
jgi:hypothetical protein